MARTLRSKRLRALLWREADGRCVRCGIELPANWHADHIIPFRVSRDTNVHEMQALCPKCNLRKGDRMQLRSHQTELAEAIRNKSVNDLPLSILAWVVPGGGKSWLPGLVAQRFPQMKVAWFVPRVALKLQATRSMKNDFGIQLRESDNTPDPSRGLHGFVASQQSLTAMPELYVQEFRRHPYILVTDEIHHAKIRPNGTRNELAYALDQLASLARVHLKMTGTLETNDNSTIWGCEYGDLPRGLAVDADRSGDIVIRYNRRTAIMEGAIVPIEFHHVDGIANYIDAEGDKEVTLSTAGRKEKSAALFTALRTELAVALTDTGVEHWQQHGDRMVIVCAFQSDAKEHAKRLRQRGIEAALAITDEGRDAMEAIERFRTGGCRVLVTCAMCYEGLDVPPITHLICLTHIRSTPWIEQMLARSWRSSPGKFKCWAFVPEDPDMLQVIDRIRSEIPASISILRDGTERASGGRGGPAPSVVPLRSEAESIRREMLDSLIAPGVIRDRVVEAFRKLGLAPDDPLVDQMVTKLAGTHARPANAPMSLTPSEEEARLRKGIHKMLNAKDADTGSPFGTRMKELHKRMGYRSFDVMTLEELRRAANIAANLCA